MASQNSPLKDTSLDLEIEAIKRFRALAPFLPLQCRVWRELNGRDTLLCLDWADCPQELEMNEQEWQEIALLLAYSCDYLGLADFLVFRNGEQTLGWMSLEEIA